MDYDIIIAGGSFSGLAVAAQLRGKRVLLVEPNPIGRVQTSACGTLLEVLAASGTMDSLLQIHEAFVLHLPHRTYELPLPDPFCTFDYHTFCQSLLEQCDVEVLRASVLGHRGHLVYTSHGAFDAGLLIDATGWRAALAANSRQQKKPRHGKSFGIETTLPLKEAGLHFWYDPAHLGRKNVAWIFPIGHASRAGLASYVGETRLKSGLIRWLEGDLGQVSNHLFGGFFPYRRQPATRGHILCVGDAAGQCLPLTGEGIRPALYFGTLAGQLARAYTEGLLSEPQVLTAYRRQVAAHNGLHKFLLLAQKCLTNLPMGGVERLAAVIHRHGLFTWLMHSYRQLMDPARIVVPGSHARVVPLFEEIAL